MSSLYNYIINLKNNQLYQKVVVFFFFLFILSLFFPIRHVFFTKEAYLTGQYSDFTSFSLYLSDILLFILFILLILPRGIEFFPKIKQLSINSALRLPTTYYPLLAISPLILDLILHFSSNSLYWTLKWVELIVAYGTVRAVIREKGKEIRIKQIFFRFFSILCGVQSLIAIYQFFEQRPLGLNRLGEQLINPLTPGFAKIIVSGETLVRGYGTFPHPNVLSAFLLTGLLFAIYLSLNSKKWTETAFWGLIILINTLGLTVTFSRAAYLAYALGLCIFFGSLILKTYLHNKKEFWPQVNKLGGTLIFIIISILSAAAIFKPYLLNRAVINDNALSERITYNQIGLKMIEGNLLFGVGAGESVLYMQQYSQEHLEPWQKQPIHNYFLLSATELGIPAALFLLWIFLYHLKLIINSIKSEHNFQLISYRLSLITIISCFLLLMLLDHYFYTLQQTQMLLWIILALISSTTKNSLGEGALHQPKP